MELHLITKQMPDFISMAFFFVCSVVSIVPGSALDHVYQIFFHLFVKLIVCLSVECTFNSTCCFVSVPQSERERLEQGKLSRQQQQWKPCQYESSSAPSRGGVGP